MDFARGLSGTDVARVLGSSSCGDCRVCVWVRDMTDSQVDLGLLLLATRGKKREKSEGLSGRTTKAGGLLYESWSTVSRREKAGADRSQCFGFAQAPVEILV